ncbi:MAG: hypothetical protein II863_14155, partial [Kiritimatiellae bacterium]|nr:hypothetical protein [Kiritimatiellia bacterium]
HDRVSCGVRARLDKEDAMNGVETANENAAETTLDSLHQTVKGGFAGMNRRLARIMRSMKTVETGLADVG